MASSGKNRVIIMSERIIPFILILSTTIRAQESPYCIKQAEYSSEDKSCANHAEFSNKRFILYDVNAPEGFNLRRDVYLRSAIFVKKLIEKNKRYDWRLVLPPWGNLYHWQSRDIGPQRRLPWSTFFDVESLRGFVPVVEMHEFFKEYSQSGSTLAEIDRVYELKNDEKMFKTGDFRDRNEIVDCVPEYSGRFWGYSNVTAREIKCLIFHGTVSGLEKNLYPDIYSSVMFDHMEIALHDSYGSAEYWKARRSMRYNSALYEIADHFRDEYLGSNDVDDDTELPKDWRKEKSKRNARGGPYLCVHLRRRDFLSGRASSVPTIKNAASQLTKKMEKLGLGTIFVATDAEDQEYNELKSYLKNYTVTKYSPSDEVRKLYKDGGVAIIDQIICSKARYFIGTHESTFTFRIQEDREIIGFPSETTFNRLCGNDNKNCKSGGSWKIVWR